MKIFTFQTTIHIRANSEEEARERWYDEDLFPDENVTERTEEEFEEYIKERREELQNS